MAEMNNAPYSIGIIMDGNRRWARERGVPTLEGHTKGYEKIEEVLSWANAVGVHEVIIYGFSTENWNRAKEEVAYLMQIFEHVLAKWLKKSLKEDTKIRFIGERDRFSKKIIGQMEKLEEQTREKKGATLAIALSYGGRSEIVHAANALIAAGKSAITEEELRSAMWSAGLRDPDIIIRPGGEKRLSNFLTWQSVYSELFFTDTYWPDFSEKEFSSILLDFSKRERRQGR